MIKSNSSAALYYKDVGNFKLLSKEEELKLGEQVKRGGEQSRRAVNRLVESNLRLVVKIAQDFQGRGLDLEDLISEGNSGLFTAAKKFDPNKGARFSYYSSFWIRQHIFRAIANNGRLIRIPSNSLDKYSKILSFISEYKKENNEEPSIKLISESLGYAKSRVKEIMVAAKSAVPLDSKVSQEGETRIHDVVPDENLNPEESCAQSDDHSQLEIILSKLNKREAYIVRNRFGMEDGSRSTLEDLGKELGVTRERVRQIESRALSKLKVLSKGRIER
tara:strand:+ start:5077 stop:5904 length:828 start_codon:yes stop_codon:yes gene_type:complete